MIWGWRLVRPSGAGGVLVRVCSAAWGCLPPRVAVVVVVWLGGVGVSISAGPSGLRVVSAGGVVAGPLVTAARKAAWLQATTWNRNITAGVGVPVGRISELVNAAAADMEWSLNSPAPLSYADFCAR